MRVFSSARVEKILISREKSKSKMSSASFDIRNIVSIDTSYEFCKGLIKNLAARITDGENPHDFLSSSFYFHRHLGSPSAEEKSRTRRHRDLTAFVEGRHLPQSESPGLPRHAFDSEASPSSFECNVSAIYLLPDSAGHIVLHLFPYRRSIFLDILSNCQLDFFSIASILKDAFDLDIESQVSVFESPRRF